MPMLEIQDIHKSFGEREVLKGVGLTVEKGAVVAILGPSGSGKTTLLRCINFLEKADSGSLLFDGERVDLARVSRADVARLRRKTAFVFQSYNLFRNKTVLQNVTEGLIVARRMHKDQAEAIAVQMLEKVGMADRCSQYPHQLSGGQQQRVAIARALATSPEIIYFDEPTSALDPDRTGGLSIDAWGRAAAKRLSTSAPRALCHLAATETDRGLDLVPRGEELGRLGHLGVEVVGVNIERKAGLFDFDHFLVLLGFLLLLLLLEAVLAVIQQLAHRGLGLGARS